MLPEPPSATELAEQILATRLIPPQAALEATQIAIVTDRLPAIVAVALRKLYISPGVRQPVLPGAAPGRT